MQSLSDLMCTKKRAFSSSVSSIISTGCPGGDSSVRPDGPYTHAQWWEIVSRLKGQPHRLGVNVTSLVSQAKSHHTLLSSSSPQGPAPQPPSNWGRVAEWRKLPLTTNPSYLTESQLRVGRLGQAHGLYLWFNDITCRAFIDTRSTLSLIRPRTFPGTDGPRPHS